MNSESENAGVDDLPWTLRLQMKDAVNSSHPLRFRRAARRPDSRSVTGTEASGVEQLLLEEVDTLTMEPNSNPRTLSEKTLLLWVHNLHLDGLLSAEQYLIGGH